MSIASAAPVSVEIAARLGFDLIVLDARQGAVSPFSGELSALIRAGEAAGASTLVSLPEATPGTVNRALNDGAAGVIAPFVRGADDARALVDASRYPPLGVRGAAPVVRAAGYGTQDWDDYHAETNSERIVLAGIEDPAALDAAVEILAVEGLDGIFVDLLAIAAAADGDPAALPALATATSAAHNGGKVVAVNAAVGASAIALAEAGCDLVVLESDLAVCAEKMVEMRASLQVVPRLVTAGGVA